MLGRRSSPRQLVVRKTFVQILEPFRCQLSCCELKSLFFNLRPKCGRPRKERAVYSDRFAVEFNQYHLEKEVYTGQLIEEYFVTGSVGSA